MWKIAECDISINHPIVGDIVDFRLQRNPAGAADTNTGNLYVTNCRFIYRARTPATTNNTAIQ
jgi:hypothetical protein